MKTPKHTPGDWLIGMTNEGTYRVGVGAALSVALCPYTGSHRSKETALANATLIAAAPEMLDVLKQVERTFGDRFPDVVAVVAKAEGVKS